MTAPFIGLELITQNVPIVSSFAGEQFNSPLRTLNIKHSALHYQNIFHLKLNSSRRILVIQTVFYACKMTIYNLGQ